MLRTRDSQIFSSRSKKKKLLKDVAKEIIYGNSAQINANKGGMATPPKKMDNLEMKKEINSEIQNAGLPIGAATKTEAKLVDIEK